MKEKILVDSRIDKTVENKLISEGFEIIKVSENPCFDRSVSAHPDMNVLVIDETMFLHPNTNVRIHNSVTINEPKINEKGSLSYPDDVKLNAVCVGNDFICRIESVAKEALFFAQKCGKRIINVNQGYVKCNVAVVSIKNKAIITEDEGIAKILEQFEYDVLKLKTHSVNLFPYEYGFIGGASGLIGNKIYFTGCIERHPEYQDIKSFCEKYDVGCVSLSEELLYDYGSIIKI